MSDPVQKAPWPLNKKIKLGAFAVLLVLVLIIVFQNTATVETQLLFITLTMPRAVLLFGTFLIGFALGSLAQIFRSRR